MENGNTLGLVVWQSLKVGLLVIVAFPDTGQSSDAERSELENIGSAHIVDVGSGPATVIEFEKVIASLMISADKDGQTRSLFSATVIFVKVAQLSELGWHGGDVEIMLVPDGL